MFKTFLSNLDLFLIIFRNVFLLKIRTKDIYIYFFLITKFKKNFVNMKRIEFDLK